MVQGRCRVPLAYRMTAVHLHRTRSRGFNYWRQTAVAYLWTRRGGSI